MRRALPGLASFALAAVFSAGAAAIDTPVFVDEAASAGIDVAYTGGWEHFVGGGVAVFDCDDNGFPDLYFAGGAGPARLYRNVGDLAGALRFSPVDGSPLAVAAVTGAYPLDIDSDGRLDLAVLRVGENALFRGLGDCRFEPANMMWGFDGGRDWTTAFSAVWEPGADWPTLAIGNYVDRAREGAPFGTCHDNYLHRPAGVGYARPTALRPGHCSLSVLFSDWNRDGVPDLRISNDRQYYRGGQEQLWQLSGGQFAEFGPQDGWRPLKIWGMGIASHDLTRDGYPEYFLTSMADNKLQTLAARPAGARFGTLQPAYEDIAYGLGATVHRPYVDGEIRPSTAWHAEFDDLNNDGFIDLFIAKGNVEGMVDFAERDPNNLLLGQADGSFREAAPEAGIVTFERARGAAVADLNLDGLLDIVVVNREQNAELWRSLGAGATDAGDARPMGGWTMLRLAQTGSNPQGVGAWVEVKTGAHIQRREVTVGGGHAGGEAGWIHFGVGTSERVEVRVQWPDGTWGPWLRGFANQFMVIERDRERPLYWRPAPSAG